MFSIACERRPHANKGRYPGVQGLGRPEIPGPPQEVSDQVPHTFDGIRCARQPQVRGHLIGSVMIKIPKKFTDRHLHLASKQWALHGEPQTAEGSPQGGPVRQLQGLTGQLVQGFADAPAGQGRFVSSPSTLQLADEMEVAQLQHPPVLTGQRLHPSQVIGHHTSNAPADLGRDRLNELPPDPDVFPSRAQHRVQKDRVMLLTRFQRHQIQHPGPPSEPHPQPIHQQDQIACGQGPCPGPGHHMSQGLAEAVAEPLRCQPTPRGMGAQRVLPKEHSLHQGLWDAVRRTASLLAPNTPGSTTRSALSPSGPKPGDPRSTTDRFRVLSLHAREVSASGGSKYASQQAFQS